MAKKVGIDIYANIKALTTEVEKARSQMRDLDKNVLQLSSSIGSLEQNATKGGLSFGKLFGAISASSIATRALSALFDVTKRTMTFLMTEPLKAAASFETTMTKISSTIGDISDGDIKQLGDDIVTMAKRFPKTPDELGLGLYTILQKGITDTSEAMQLLEVSTKASIGGNADLGKTVDLTTTIMNAYRMTAEQTRISLDAVFVGAQRGAAEFSDLAGSLGTTLGTAAQLEVQIPQVVAAVETMANAGFSADEASVSLNAFLTSVIQASDGTSEAAKTARALGLEYNTATLKAQGLGTFIENVTRKVGNNEVAMQSLTGNVRAYRAVASLAGKGNEFFNETLKAMEDSAGSLDKAYNRMAGTIQNKLALAQNKFNIALLEAGRKNAPELSKAVDELNDSLDAQSEGITNAAQALSKTFVDGMRAVIDEAPFLIAALENIARIAGNVISAIASVPRGFAIDKATKNFERGQSLTDIDAAFGNNKSKLVGTKYMSRETYNAYLKTLSGDKQNSELSLEQTMKAYNEKFGTNKPLTEEQIKRMAEEERKKTGGTSTNQSFGGSGGSSSTKKDTTERDRARENLDRLRTLREELLLRKELGIITAQEERKLAMINARTDFMNDVIDDGVEAWRKQKGELEQISEKISSIGEDIKKATKDFDEAIAELDRDTQKKKIDTFEELLRKRKDLQDKFEMGVISEEEQKTLNQVNSDLAAGLGSASFDASKVKTMLDEMELLRGLVKANAADLQQMARLKELESSNILAFQQGQTQSLQSNDPFSMINRDDTATRTSLTDKHTKAMNDLRDEQSQQIALKSQIELLEQQKLDAVSASLDKRKELTLSSYKTIEVSTKKHADKMQEEFSRIAASMKSVMAMMPSQIISGLSSQSDSHDQTITVNQNNYGQAASNASDRRSILWEMNKLLQ